MKRGVFLLFSLFGCSSTPDNPMPDGGNGNDSGMSTTCAVASAVEIQGTAAPNQTVKLAVKDTGSGRDYTVQWSVPVGTVTPMNGKTVDWAIGKDVAIDGPQTVTVTATVSVMGCDPQDLSLDVKLDWPDAQRTIVLYNDMMGPSKSVADYYMQFRNIPMDHACAMSAMTMDAIDDMTYGKVLDKVLACRDAIGKHVFYIAPVWGVPYMVSGKIDDLGNPQNKATVSMDALLVYGERSRTATANIKIPLYQTGTSITSKYNPYVPFGQARTKYGKDYFLVTRVDAADDMAAKA